MFTRIAGPFAVIALVASTACSQAPVEKAAANQAGSRTLSVRVRLVGEATVPERSWTELWRVTGSTATPAAAAPCTSAGQAPVPPPPSQGAAAAPVSATSTVPPNNTTAPATGPDQIVPEGAVLPAGLIDLDSLSVLVDPKDPARQVSLFAPRNVTLVTGKAIEGSCERTTTTSADKQTTIQYLLKPVPREVTLIWTVPTGSSDALNSRVDLSPKVRAHEGARSTDEGVVEVQYRPATQENVAENRLGIVLLDDKNEVVMLRPFTLATREGIAGYGSKLKLPDSKALALNWFGGLRYEFVLLHSRRGEWLTSARELEVVPAVQSLTLGLSVVLVIVTALAFVNPFSPLRDKSRHDAWNGVSWRARAARFPLHFAITPSGRYSLSLLQVSWWTIIVGFSFAYVYSSRGSIFKPSPQVLTLLGIAVGSALSAIAIASSKLPNLDRYLPTRTDSATTPVRLPRLRDLFTDGDRLSVFKFQVFLFTVLIGATALAEVWQTGTFPTFEPEILALMGISNTAYVASELGSDQQIKDIRDLTKLIDEARASRDLLVGQRAAVTQTITGLEIQIAGIPADDPRLPPLNQDLGAAVAEKARVTALLEAQVAKVAELQNSLAGKVRETSPE